jgi:hypothetical protein
MKSPSQLDTDIVYFGQLVRSGFQGAVSVGRRALKDDPKRSVLSQSVRQSWKPAAVGAYLGVLAGGLRRKSTLSSALWGGFAGIAVGLAGGALWNSRSVTGDMVRGGFKSIEAARDKRWLELNPINYG